MTRLLLLAAILLVASPAPAQDEKSKQDPPAKQDELKERALKASEEMTKVRGLKMKQQVQLGLYSKEELMAFVRKEMEREAPKEKVLKIQKAYQHFGLLPKEFDLYESIIDLYGSSIGGFYHHKAKEMKLIRSTGPAEGDDFLKKQFGKTQEDMTLVHELTHAAQDQHFDLSTLPIDDDTNDDLVFAIKGLVEGDATTSGWKYMIPQAEVFDMWMQQNSLSYKAGALPGKAAELPAYLRKTLTFPYGHGTDFVLKIWRTAKEDWSVVDKMFVDPPSSTEQILHPAKYSTERDNPTLITIEGIVKTVGPDWTEILNNVHGEFCIRLLFSEYKAQRVREIEKIASGWDGDRFHTFENGKKLLTVWYTTWDSDDDAKEFFEGYVKLLGVKYEGASQEAGDQRVLIDATEQKAGKALVERRGADVLVIDGADAALLEKANALWTSAKKVELKKVERVKLNYQCPKHAGETSWKPAKCGVCGGELQKKDSKDDPKQEKKDY